MRIKRDGNLFFAACAAVVLGIGCVGVAGALEPQEIAERPAPELKAYELNPGVIIGELEKKDRIISGLQHQVTVLHAKKADRENVAELDARVVQSEKRLHGSVERERLLVARVEALEQKVSRIVKILKLKSENGK